MNYTQEHIANSKMLDYMIDRILEENEKKNKVIHDELVREINDLKGKLLSKENDYKDLLSLYNETVEENKVIGEANNELKALVQELRGKKDE